MSSSFDSLAKLLLRLLLGGQLLLHGIYKLRHGVAGIERMLAERGLPEWVAYGVFIGEVVAPALLIAGFKTRAAALIMAVSMIVAVVLAGSDDLARLGRTGGWGVELQAMYVFGSLAVALLGAGRYSVSRGNGRWD